MSRRSLIVTVVTGLIAVAVARPATAQGARQEQGAMEVAEIKPDVFLITAPEGNALVLFGEHGPLVVSPASRNLAERAKAFVSTRGAQPRYAVIVDADSALQHGDAGWNETETVTIAHENMRRRIRIAMRSDSTMAARLPMVGFGYVFQIAVNDDEIHAVHEPGGYSDSDMIVHFEERRFIYLGNMFTNDGYPSIALDRGGSIDGLIKSASKFLGMWEKSPEWAEPVVPGRGPRGTMRDLRAYHDMLVSVRDRVASMAAAGQALDSIVASRPTREFDERWGHGPVSPDEFVALVYRSLSASKAQEPGSGHGGHHAGGPPGPVWGRSGAGGRGLRVPLTRLPRG